MSLPITIPYTFASATTSIPLANLDTNFTTVVNAVNGIANGTNTLANVAITGGTIYNAGMGNVTVGGVLGVSTSVGGTPNYGTTGQVLTSQGTSTPPIWAAGGGGGSGTVNSGTSGQLTYYASTGTAVSGTTTGTGVVAALSVNTGSSGSFVVNGGALGTPSSGTLTNATGLPISGIAAAVVNTQTSTSPTLSFANNMQTVELANGSSNVSVYLPVLSTAVKVDIVQLGTGTVQLVASGGATVNSRVGTTIYLSAQYSGCTVYNNSNGTLGSWIVVGDVAPSA